MSAPAEAQEWPEGQQAEIEYAASASKSETTTYTTSTVRQHGRWYDKRTGFEIPQSLIRSVNPLYLVSLDAAVEAAAKADFERRRGDGEVGWRDTWESETESKRDLIRAFVQPLVTAAVMGGAQ